MACFFEKMKRSHDIFSIMKAIVASVSPIPKTRNALDNSINLIGFNSLDDAWLLDNWHTSKLRVVLVLHFFQYSIRPEEIACKRLKNI